MMTTAYSAQDIAHVAHEANRAFQTITGDPATSPSWDDAPDWQRGSAIDGVRQAIAGASAAELHSAWCASKRADGWTYGEVKDAVAKTHPCLVAYKDLPEHQRRKDILFRAVVVALTTS